MIKLLQSIEDNNNLFKSQNKDDNIIEFACTRLELQVKI